MNTIFSLLILLMCFFNGQANAAQVDCNPIGQYSHPSGIRKNLVMLSQIGIENSLMTSAEINSPQCEKIKATLNEQAFEKLQELSASAQLAFVIMQKKDSLGGVKCLTGIRSIEEMQSQSWETSTDGCSQLGLVAMKSTDGMSKIYVSSKQAELLMNRFPASQKKIKKK